MIDLENVLSLAGNKQTTQSIAEFYESDVDLSTILNTELAQIFCKFHKFAQNFLFCIFLIFISFVLNCLIMIDNKMNE